MNYVGRGTVHMKSYDNTCGGYVNGGSRIKLSQSATVSCQQFAAWSANAFSASFAASCANFEEVEETRWRLFDIKLNDAES